MWSVVAVPAVVTETVAVLAASAEAAKTAVATVRAATSAARWRVLICCGPFALSICICQLVGMGFPSTFQYPCMYCTR